MDFTGQLLLGFLEEDDSRRVLFRVRPLLTQFGALAQEDVEELENEGFLRIAPDRLEQHTFKERMRSLGALCLINLRGAEPALGKVRPNKNYAPNRNEPNRYIIYSDAITALPDNLMYEVISEDKSEQAMTKQYYLRSGGRISGPYCKSGSLSCPASQTLMPDNDRLFLVEMPDKSSKMFYWPQVEEEGTETVPQEMVLEPDALEPALPVREEPPVFEQSGFPALAYQFMEAMKAAGFEMHEDKAKLSLLLLLVNQKVQLLGDCLADACLAKQVIASLIPEDHRPKMLCSSKRVMKKTGSYLKKPWPMLALDSIKGLPQREKTSQLDEKALSNFFESIHGEHEDTLALYAKAVPDADVVQMPFPLSLKRDIADYLSLALSSGVLGQEEIVRFAETCYVDPWLTVYDPALDL